MAKRIGSGAPSSKAVTGGERRVAAQIDFDRGREPAEAIVGAGLAGSNDEARVGEVRLAGERRHPLVGGGFLEHDDRSRVACERLVREHVDRPQPHLRHSARLTEFALGAIRTVERERRRLIEFRVIAPVSTPPSPRRIACPIALLARDEDDALMIPAARVHLFHARSVTHRRDAVAGLCARPRLASGCASNERCRLRRRRQRIVRDDVGVAQYADRPARGRAPQRGAVGSDQQVDAAVERHGAEPRESQPQAELDKLPRR